MPILERTSSYPSLHQLGCARVSSLEAATTDQLPSFVCDNLVWVDKEAFSGLSLQIHYRWTDGAAPRGAMSLGAYHSLPAPVRIIPPEQIRAPMDIHSLIRN
jgi:hypothetical protein